MRVQLSCAENYYGKNCGKFCKPLLKSRCDPKSGEQVCVSGNITIYFQMSADVQMTAHSQMNVQVPNHQI